MGHPVLACRFQGNEGEKTAVAKAEPGINDHDRRISVQSYYIVSVKFHLGGAERASFRQALDLADALTWSGVLPRIGKIEPRARTDAGYGHAGRRLREFEADADVLARFKKWVLNFSRIDVVDLKFNARTLTCNGP